MCSRRTSGKGRLHRVSYVTASWLEETVWADVRRFLEDPGQVLERLREQLGADDATDELETRREELSGRLAAKQTATSTSTPRDTSPRRSWRRIYLTSRTRRKT